MLSHIVICDSNFLIFLISFSYSEHQLSLLKKKWLFQSLKKSCLLYFQKLMTKVPAFTPHSFSTFCVWPLLNSVCTVDCFTRDHTLNGVHSCPSTLEMAFNSQIVKLDCIFGAGNNTLLKHLLHFKRYIQIISFPLIINLITWIGYVKFEHFLVLRTLCHINSRPSRASTLGQSIILYFFLLPTYSSQKSRL